MATTSCPRCQCPVSESFVFCPRCAKLIWPHFQKDFPRRVRMVTIMLGVPALGGSILGMIFARSVSGTAVGAGFGFFMGVLVFWMGSSLDLWD